MRGHFRCSCVVVVICARAFSFYPFLWWCLVFKISDAEKKKKNDDEYTRGLTDVVEDQIFWCFHFSCFFTFVLSKKCKPPPREKKRRESLFEQNENIFFNFTRHGEEKKKKNIFEGKSIESPPVRKRSQEHSQTQ